MDREREHPPAKWRDAARQSSEIGEQLFGAGERLRIGRLQPPEVSDFFHTARFQSEDDLREIEPFHLGQFLRRALDVFAFRPEPQTMARRRSSRASGALIGRSAADFFDEECVDPAARIEPRHSRHAAINDHAHAVDRERSLDDIRRNDRLALFIMAQRCVLFARRQLAMQRHDNELVAHAASAHRGNGAAIWNAGAPDYQKKWRAGLCIQCWHSGMPRKGDRFFGRR